MKVLGIKLTEVVQNPYMEIHKVLLRKIKENKNKGINHVQRLQDPVLLGLYQFSPNSSIDSKNSKLKHQQDIFFFFGKKCQSNYKISWKFNRSRITKKIGKKEYQSGELRLSALKTLWNVFMGLKLT